MWNADDLEAGRRLARRIDQRITQKVQAHERRLHPCQAVPLVEAVAAEPHEPIADHVLCEVITMAEKQGRELIEVAEEMGLPLSRFQRDLADYEGRYRQELRRLRYRRED